MISEQVLDKIKPRPGFYTLTETRFIIDSRFKETKKNPTYPFVYIGKTETCAKFQQKKIYTPWWLELMAILTILVMMVVVMVIIKVGGDGERNDYNVDKEDGGGNNDGYNDVNGVDCGGENFES